MAIGDISYFSGFLKNMLPKSWFPDNSPVLTGVQSGPAYVWNIIYNQLQYVYLQTRITTATGDNLDIIAFDYFGNKLYRRDFETDAIFRLRIKKEILRPRVTRLAISNALQDLTGYAPRIVEPWNTSDCGGWDTNSFYYDTVGCWGDINLPFQCFITAYRPPGQGIPLLSGWDCKAGGWDAGLFAWTDESSFPISHIGDDEIRDAVNSTISAGTTVWLNIDAPPSYTANRPVLNRGFILNVNRLN